MKYNTGNYIGMHTGSEGFMLIRRCMIDRLGKIWRKGGNLWQSFSVSIVVKVFQRYKV